MRSGRKNAAAEYGRMQDQEAEYSMTKNIMNENMQDIQREAEGPAPGETLTETEELRYELALGRLAEIRNENIIGEKYNVFFRKGAGFLLKAEQLRMDVQSGWFEKAGLQSVRERNRQMYGDVLPENYDRSYGNPAFAAETFGDGRGQIMSALYTEIRGAIPFAFENRRWDLLILMELFLEYYGAFSVCALESDQPEALPAESGLRQIFYSYCSDYCQEFMDIRTAELVDADRDFVRNIVMTADLTDPRYLYRFGEYITENEEKTAAFLAGMTQEEIDSIARTWTEGYRIGFLMGRKDITKKKTVNIRYRAGFERVIRAAVKQFEQIGLESIIYRAAAHAVNKRGSARVGFYGAVPNPQFDYDHKNDAAIFLDEHFVTRKLQALRTAFEKLEKEASVHGGPAVMEVFGEIPFTPVPNDKALSLTEEQQKLQVRYGNESGQITNRFIIGSERSFTIIAYPAPEIGPQFEEIFRETIRINNLDYHKYQRIQQHLIDALDQGVKVHVRGMNGNETDITVALRKLEDPEKETIFENCVADVNIPVGEVFTSPVLEGTSGLLHVSKVYLEDFQYRDLKIRVKNGMTTEYSCANFEDPAMGKRYVEENILFHHPSVPVGEFAIGTNTTAYRIAREYRIADKLPILIAEKMGPHFAFGDTCYSYQEDTAVYNPDGKEIIARDNERSALRKTDPSKAYFGCHTDITIPYDELGHIQVIRADGSTIPIIENGRFVLPGTEELNQPLT